MNLAYGVTTVRGKTSPPPVRTVESAAIVIAGTAPAADTLGKFSNRNGSTPGTAIKHNYPFLLTQRGDAPSDDLGETGTLPDALDSIFAQGNFKVIMIIVPEIAAVAAVALSGDYKYNASTDQDTFDGLSGADLRFALITEDSKKYLAFQNLATGDQDKLDKIIERQTITISAAGSSPTQTYTAESDYDPTKDRVQVNDTAAITGFVAGTAYDPDIDAINADQAKAFTSYVNARGNEGDLTGIYAALSAESVQGIRPRLICASGLDTGSMPDPGVGNPLAGAMLTVADKLGAMAIIDGPNTTHEDLKAYISAIPSPGVRAIVVDPAALVANDSGGLKEQAMSGFYAGRIAKTDYDFGFWNSPSNKPINGILGLARPIDSGFASSRAQLMMDLGVWTVINEGGGFITAGTRTPAAAVDQPYAFPSVLRTEDIISDSIQKSVTWAVAMGITKNFYSAVETAVNGFLQTLRAKGAIIEGKCYADSELNTPTNKELGHAYFNVDWVPVYPANSIVITFQKKATL